MGEVTKTSLTSPHKALLFTPTGDKVNATFPAIIFAHGLCGPAELYSDLITAIAAQGYVVIANQEQETCESPTIWNPFSAFSALDSIKEAANGKEMVQHLMEEVDYLLERSDIVDQDVGIGLVGHSMGGGAVIDAAAKLSSEGGDKAGLLKAVVAVAPWNGIPLASRPSDVAGEITAPALLFCSETDQITPCSGPWMQASGLGSSWMSETLLANAFYTTDNTWAGGVEAIFQDTTKHNDEDEDDGNKNNATLSTKTFLVEFPSGGHFALAGIDDAKLKELGQQIAKGSGLGDWWNSFFIDFNINVGEDKSNPSGESAKKVGSSVQSLMIDFLNEKLLTDESNQKKNFTQVLEDAAKEEQGGVSFSVKTS